MTPFLVTISQSLMVYPEAVQQGCVQIVSTNSVFRDVEAVVICLSRRHSRTNVVTGEPQNKATGMRVVIIRVRGQFLLAINRFRELTTSIDQVILKHATGLGVLNERCRRSIRIATLANNRHR